MIRISLSQRLSALQKHSPLLTTWPHSSLSYQHKRQKIKVIKDTLSLTIHSALSLRKPIRKTSLTLTNHTHTKKPFSSSLSPLNSQLTHSSKFPLTPSTQIRRSINKTLASLKFHSSSPKSSRRHTQPTNRNPPSSSPFNNLHNRKTLIFIFFHPPPPSTIAIAQTNLPHDSHSLSIITFLIRQNPQPPFTVAHTSQTPTAIPHYLYHRNPPSPQTLLHRQSSSNLFKPSAAANLPANPRSPPPRAQARTTHKTRNIAVEAAASTIKAQPTRMTYAPQHRKAFSTALDWSLFSRFASPATTASSFRRRLQIPVDSPIQTSRCGAIADPVGVTLTAFFFQ